MAAVGRVEGAEPDQAMDAPFRLEQSKGAAALHPDGRRLDARLLALGLLDEFDRHPVALPPSEIHPEQHLGPILAVRPPRPTLDREEGGIVGVGVAVEEIDLTDAQLLLDLLQLGGELDGHGGVAARLVALGLLPHQVGQVTGVGRPPGERLPAGELLSDVGELLGQASGAAGVVPEGGIGDLGLQGDHAGTSEIQVKGGPVARLHGLRPPWLGPTTRSWRGGV